MPPFRGGGQAGRSSCSVLHRTGFVVPPGLLHGAVGSYPAFSPLPEAFATGGLFSATLSVADGFRRIAPPLSQGVLPCGVRTFLSERSIAARSKRTPAIKSTFNPADLQKQADLLPVQ